MFKYEYTIKVRENGKPWQKSIQSVDIVYAENDDEAIKLLDKQNDAVGYYVTIAKVIRKVKVADDMAAWIREDREAQKEREVERARVEEQARKQGVLNRLIGQTEKDLATALRTCDCMEAEKLKTILEYLIQQAETEGGDL